MYSSLSGLPKVLLALLLVLMFPGEKAPCPPRQKKTVSALSAASYPIHKNILSNVKVGCIQEEEEAGLIGLRKHLSCC